MRHFFSFFVLLATLFANVAQAQIASQGFEPGVVGTWSFTSTPSKYNTPTLFDVWADTTTLAGPTTAAVGSGGWLGRDLQNPTVLDQPTWHYLDFAPIDIAMQTGVTLSFQYSVTGYDTGDSSLYFVSFDNGTTWSNPTALIIGATGGVSAAGWNTITVNIPPGSLYARLRLAAKQNGNDDWIQFDDVKLNATSVADVTPPSVVSAANNAVASITLTFSEPISVATGTNLANYIGIAGLISAVQTTTTTVTLTYPTFVQNTPNTLTVSNLADLAGNVLAAPYIYTFMINTSLPNFVFTEIMYNDPSSGNDTLEFIEIYNAGTTSQNTSGLVFSGLGIPAFTLPNVDVAAGGTFLLALEAAKAGAFYGQTFYDWGTVGLANGGSSIMLRTSTGVTIDSVFYDDEGLWPLTPDGGGPSLTLLNANTDNNIATNWAESTYLTYPAVAGLTILASPGFFGTISTISVSVSTLTLAIAENGTQVSFNVIPSAASLVPVTVTLSPNVGSTAILGTNYTLASTTVTIPANSTAPVAVDVTIIDNADVLGGKYVALDLINPVNATLGTNKQVLVMITDNDQVAPAAPTNPDIALTFLSSFQIGSGKSAEISAYDKTSKRLFVSNSITNTLEILNASNPAALSTISSISLASYGGMINSVATQNGIVAVAVENTIGDLAGKVVFFDTLGVYISQVSVGVLPDHVVFSPNGNTVLTANEAQPLVNYTADPVGSVSVIDISGGVATVTNSNVITADFTSYNSQLAALRLAGVRIFGPAGTVAQDMEPEYITFSTDGTKAYITCQENNAIAILDVATATITDIKPLGYKDHTLAVNTIDASDQSPALFQASWPIKGMYLPDAIAEFTVAGTSYLITANEGDARADYGAPSEETRVASLTLDPTAYPNGTLLKNNRLLGRLRCTNATGDTDGDGDIDMIHAFGGRSFSIWNATTGGLVYDSGNQLELITAQTAPWSALFNASNDSNTARGRSDDKGPEPEGVTTGVINGKTYGFVTLERIGGVMVYDLSNPAAPVFVQYINNRTTTGTAGPDLGPEGILFISATESPNGQPLIALSNEISGSISFYQIGVNCDGIVGSDVLQTLYADIDADTYGAGDATIGCPATGLVTFAGDCNDDVAAINPAAVEICNSGIDENCNAIVDTDITVCPKPVITLTSDITTDGATITWEAGACYSTLRYRTRIVLGGGEFGPWSLFTNVPSTALSANLTGLESLKRYQFQLQALCTPTLSSPFASTTFVTLDTFYADADGDGYGNPVVYELFDFLPSGYVLNNDDCNDLLATVYPGAQEVTNNSIDDDCDGLVDDLCAMAINFKATMQSSSSALLSWDGSPNLVSYTVQYRIFPGTTALTTVTTTSPSILLTGLVPNAQYIYLVKTNCKYSVSTDFSGVQFFTMKQDTLCDRPKLGAITQLTPTSQQLFWDFQTGTTTKSQIRYRLAGSTSPYTIKSVTGTTSHIILTGLTAATTYNYQVRVDCAGIWSSFSAIGYFTTKTDGVQALTMVETLKPEVLVYPNPTSDYLFIDAKNMQPSQVHLFDATGVKMVSISFDQAQSGIDMQGFANGVYMLQVIDEKGNRFTQSVVKFNN
jgi:Secretion system C-terminal sorting domain/Lamin Tail Domain/Putative metal-binding motif